MSSPAIKQAEEQALTKKKDQQVKNKLATYTTKSGDSIGKIAKMLGTTVSKLKEANQKLANVDKLPKGIKLKLPTKVASKDMEMTEEMKKQAKVKLFQGGGKGLKPVPEGNKGKGLSKLPTKVRNKMGFLYGGGMPMPSKKPRVSNTDYRKAAKGMLVISIDMMKKKKGKGKGKKKS
jgi:LysM repeat protein